MPKPVNLGQQLVTDNKNIINEAPWAGWSATPTNITRINRHGGSAARLLGAFTNKYYAIDGSNAVHLRYYILLFMRHSKLNQCTGRHLRGAETLRDYWVVISNSNDHGVSALQRTALRTYIYYKNVPKSLGRGLSVTVICLFVYDILKNLLI